MLSDKTCGQLFMDAFNHLTTSESQQIGFKMGFLAGLAEKVYMGACPAACIRPNLGELQIMTHAAKAIATVYDLELATFSIGEDYGIELWMFRTEAEMNKGIKQMSEANINGSFWHSLRAQLCGISPFDVDLNFHERPGCDKRTT